MKITAVEALTPLEGPPSLLAQVHTDEGVSGIGEVGLNTRTTAVHGAIVELEELLVGQDPSRIEYLWQRVSRGGFFPAGRVVSSALSALDAALWDIQGKTAGLPVYQLLGGQSRDLSLGYVHLAAERPEPDLVVAEALRRVAQGWRYLRIPVVSSGGTFDPTVAVRRTVELFRQIRTAVGDDIELIVDVHTRLPPPDAVRLCRLLEPQRPYFVEDPLRCENLDSYRSLRAQTSVPLAAGEQCASKWEFRTLIENEYIDFARIDLGIVGGLSEARKIAGMAETHGIRVATHGPVGPVAIAMATHFNYTVTNSAVQEHPSTQGQDDDRYRGVLQAIEGGLRPSPRPGLGIIIHREAFSTRRPDRREPPHLHAPDGSFTNW